MARKKETAAIYLHEANRAGRITIAHSHITSSGKGLKAFIKNIMQYPIRYEADYLFACSVLAGEWLYGKRNITKQNVDIIYNAIDIEQFRYNSQQREMGLDGSVKFLGVQDNVNEWMQAMDLFLLPSRYEGLPVVIVEAQVSGLPCVMSETITNEVMLHRVKKVSLKADLNSWVSAMDESLLENGNRENAANIIGQTGFNIIQAADVIQQKYLAMEKKR